ncbi:peptidase M20 [Rhodohalobacter sp. SW132]|uniref:M20/M25/M40 family metallo-hydrolase n=1 Tax=Rhodohalobacter sp. SW132 TaxID=2293433 RepID=UPI000E24E591|nr:M20/M25/M40 family metallo-hydrolase [Rhodohalobacter sp. SW132]REL29239.1 peptidase M20 [Rhodohalobacter sp. SW132]
MKKLNLVLLSALFLFAITSCSGEDPATEQQDVSEIPETLLDQALEDVEYLASDELEGRRTGTEGNRMAQDYIENRFESLGLQTFGESYRHLFDHTNRRTNEEFTDAVNLIGYIEGSANQDRYIVVTAHYDHLGISDGEIYNGADDNASGTGGLMAAAAYFTDNQPENSIMFIAFDAEEQGLGGARYFVENPVVSLEDMVLNINMDMISTNFEDELYAVGTYHYPYLKPMIEEYTADASIDVLFGYDSDEWDQDWTLSSDHGPFHQQGVPFVYFGVEDHDHYHAPTDTFENINPEFYRNSVRTIIRVIEGFDRDLDSVVEQSDR